MAEGDLGVRIYRDLAECYEAQHEAQMRDRFLVLAADAAREAGRADEAERLRVRLLQCNPQHLLKPFANFADAMKSTDVQNYVAALRRSHPLESAQRQLESIRHAKPSLAAPALEPLPESRAEESVDPLKVYRMQEPEPPPRKKPTGQSGMPAFSRPSTASQPAPTRTGYHTREEPEPFASMGRGAMDYDDMDSSASRWVSTGLFVIMLIACLAVAVYTIALPFLPPEWFPRAN